MISRTDLAAMLCSRLCHDMLSPVGALANGLELLADEQDPKMRAQVIELLEQSARISTEKLKFFRLAFGAAGGFGEAIPVDEARAVIDALAADA
jgi:histidine phosphotransferase ChpT